MIHDVLLSCLDLHSRKLPLEDFVVSDAVSVFLHPCEKRILQDIIDIINLLRDVAKFSKTYGSNYNVLPNSPILETDEPLQNGLYIRALCHGIDKVLAEYYCDINELERQYLMNPTQTLLYIYHKLQVYQPLALFLKRLIHGIKLQKLHGCNILAYLHQNVLHGDARIRHAMKIIQATVNGVFFKQLSHWLLYAKIVDNYGEFFIQCSEMRSNTSTMESEKVTSSGSGKHTLALLSVSFCFSTLAKRSAPIMQSIKDAASTTYADIWHYQIFHDYLPYYLPISWAEKVLFIGQTVLMFSIDANKTNKKNHTNWNRSEKDKLQTEISLWDGQDHVFFAKIQALQDNDEINVTCYERLINEIKNFVTNRLSVIAVDQADLVKELKLIKDFYLLARGELYLEYIRLTSIVGLSHKNENKAREYVKAFEVAAHSIGITDELEQFSLSVASISDMSSENSKDSNLLNRIQLDYKIKWPLHLLFAPIVIERYNKVFRFLLLLKKTQFELHNTWFMQKSKMRCSGNKLANMQILLLQNQLMFFVDNLQYYIQVDVLESQFSILLHTILSKADFEQITRAHSIFLANILSYCFLLEDNDAMHSSTLHSITVNSNHPVHLILNEILEICEKFCIVLQTTDAKVSIEKEIIKLDESFSSSISSLLSLLTNLKGSTAPLSQFILRLDFNHWFSTRKELALEE